jgi:hypothetical protein
MENDFQLKPLKDLPRDKDGEISRYFTANGNMYKICSVEEVLSPWRYTEFERMSIMAGFGMNFDILYTRLKDLEGKIYEIDEAKQQSKTPAIMLINAIQNGIVKTGELRWEQTAYFATLFIVKENEDLTKWTIEEAGDKINDWNTEGFKLTDFFFLTAVSIPEFAKRYSSLIKEQMNLQSMGIALEGID